MSDKLHPPRIKWLVEPTFDEDGVQRSAGIDSLGREHGDPVPVSPPIGLSTAREDELHTALRNLLQKERARFMAAVEAEEFETEDEANDFHVPEDIFPIGNEPWEDVFEFPAEPPSQAPADGGKPADALKGEPNGGVPGAKNPTPPPPEAISEDQTVSEGLVSQPLAEKKVEKQSGKVSDKSVGSRGVSPSLRR